MGAFKKKKSKLSNCKNLKVFEGILLKLKQ